MTNREACHYTDIVEFDFTVHDRHYTDIGLDLKGLKLAPTGHRTNDLSTSIYLGFRSLGSFSPLPPTLMTWTDFFWGRIWTCNLFHCVALVRYSRCSWHLVKLFKRCLMSITVYLGTWLVQVSPSSGWGPFSPQMVALLASLFGAQTKC